MPKYCGSGKKQNDSWITATINLGKIDKKDIQEYRGTKFIKININIKDQPDQYGKDVAISLDEYKKDRVEVTKDSSGDLPF